MTAALWELRYVIGFVVALTAVGVLADAIRRGWPS